MSAPAKDYEIKVALRKGDLRKAFDLLYKSTWPKIQNYVMTNSGSKAEAEDIFHDALTVFFKQVKLGKYDAQYDADGYIYVVARNLWINSAKKKNHQVALGDLDAPADIDLHLQIVQQERYEVIMRMLAVIGERCKELLTWTIFHNLKLDEVKEKMGFQSVDAVKTKHYKCKQRLIAQVKENSGIKAYLRND